MIYVSLLFLFISVILMNKRLSNVEEQNAILSLIVEDLLSKPEDNK